MSNAEKMVVPREHELKILPQPFDDLLSGEKTGEVRDCRDREFRVGDSVRLVEISGLGLEHGPTGRTMCRVITHIQTGFGLPENLCVLSYGQPAQQDQGEPVALPGKKYPPDWNIGTLQRCNMEYMDGWNACLDEIAKLGSLYTHPASMQGEPVAWRRLPGNWIYADKNDATDEYGLPMSAENILKRWQPLYTHADPAEVELLRAQVDTLAEWYGNALNELAERDALLRVINRKAVEFACSSIPTGHECRFGEEIASLSSSAEPSAPVEIDERAELTIHDVLVAFNYAEDHPHKYLRGTTNWAAAFAHSLNKQARAALERKP